MRCATFRGRLRGGARLAGTFVKTPHLSVIEVLAQSELDFLCLDAEHAPFDRAGLDGCLAMARALDVPALVRVADGSAGAILQALDAGAVGVVIPHVTSVQQAQAIAKAAHFGDGGRGFAGSTRWAGYASRPMSEVLDRDAQTVVLAQIEEPAGVAHCAQIAQVEGIDGLFAGPADLSVSYGHRSLDNADLPAAMTQIGAAARVADKAFVTFAPTAQVAQAWAQAFGVTAVLVSSEQSWMRDAATAAARAWRSGGEG